ncbi:MAG: SURF1 family protein [Gammaproteobacteria bacterium]|nr:SURF1 family protein [Gammaproteobacteria bacterium]NNC97753.1 SURF1 family protein [Gammaproteobacteria bacterium]NNM13938.1 SURF1 family protein [Gammaproteobacteria bacterium]
MRDLFSKFITSRRFQPSLLPSLAYIVLLALLLSLGQWQLERAEEKTGLFSAFASGDTQAIDLKNALRQSEPRYQRIKLSGHFVSEQQYLLDNIVRKGQIGLQVMTPFKKDDGKTLIVNRGWIPLALRHAPASELNQALNISSQKMTVSGRLDKLLRPGLQLDTQIPDTLYPKIVQFPTFEQFEADLGTQLVPWQILLDAEQENPLVKGFVREWTPHEMGPERHIGYAVQWFALALTLSIIYIVLTFKPRPVPEAESKNPDKPTI